MLSRNPRACRARPGASPLRRHTRTRHLGDDGRHFRRLQDARHARHRPPNRPSVRRSCRRTWLRSPPCRSSHPRHEKEDGGGATESLPNGQLFAHLIRPERGVPTEKMKNNFIQFRRRSPARRPPILAGLFLLQTKTPRYLGVLRVSLKDSLFCRFFGWCFCNRLFLRLVLAKLLSVTDSLRHEELVAHRYQGTSELQQPECLPL
jgi:hypothetical protein